jgi:hypothetical protein
MARIRWFLAGAAAAAGTLVAAPDAYRRLRTLVEPPERKALPPGPPPEPEAAAETAPAVDPAESDALRERIENTRARVRQKAAREPGGES